MSQRTDVLCAADFIAKWFTSASIKNTQPTLNVGLQSVALQELLYFKFCDIQCRLSLQGKVLQILENTQRLLTSSNVFPGKPVASQSKMLGARIIIHESSTVGVLCIFKSWVSFLFMHLCRVCVSENTLKIQDDTAGLPINL